MCGVFGAFNAGPAAEQIAAGLFGQQHLARDFSGLVTTDGVVMYWYGGSGLVRDVFPPDRLRQLLGMHGVGHIRYPTTEDRANIQPIRGSGLAVAHTGNLTNATALRSELERDGVEFTTAIDSECFLHLIERASGTPVERVNFALAQVRGSCALVVLFPDQLIVARDSSGNQPLSIGRRGKDSWFVATETVALDAVEAEYVRDVQPGEIVVISGTGLASHSIVGAPSSSLAPCVFRQIYYAHPASWMFGQSVIQFRLELGRRLGEEFQRRYSPMPQIDIVMPVPDSANFIALGVAQVLGLDRFLPLLIRSHYIGRTFIAADNTLRHWLIRQKFSFPAHELRGKSVLIVEDSIVRSSTLRRISQILWRVGVKAIYVAVGSPPIRHPCRYGIDTPTYDELIAHHHTPAEIERSAGVNGLVYLPIEELRQIAGKTGWCFACMDGKYPLPE
jgi:amidophosphoribosyltransferase